jgi:hypothetical protein
MRHKRIRYVQAKKNGSKIGYELLHLVERCDLAAVC